MKERYEAVKELGSGNFGVAKLVRNKTTKDLVAVKYIERGKKIHFSWYSLLLDPVHVLVTGAAANITENLTRQSKFTYGLVMEEITARDESSHVSPNGQRVLPNGGISAYGPPTTLRGIGIDRMTFAQVNITRDNTKFVNRAIVGERDVFQVRLPPLWPAWSRSLQ